MKNQSRDVYPLCVTEGGAETAFSKLVKKFDSLSIKKKRKYIEFFKGVSFSGKAEENEELADYMNSAFQEMQSFFQNRMAETLTDE
jgi:predicted CopG family antitoxin